MPSLEPYSDDGASDKDEQEHVQAESEEEVVDETIRPSPTKMRTRSKTLKPVIPEAIICSDTEDDEPRPRQRKRTHIVGTDTCRNLQIFSPKLEQVPQYCQQDICGS